MRNGRLHLVEPDTLLRMALDDSKASPVDAVAQYHQDLLRIGVGAAYELYCLDHLGRGQLSVVLKNGSTITLPAAERRIYEFALTKNTFQHCGSVLVKLD